MVKSLVLSVAFEGKTLTSPAVALGHVPRLDFQLFNYYGYFRAGQTLTLDSVWFPTQKKKTRPIALSLFIA